MEVNMPRERHIPLWIVCPTRYWLPAAYNAQKSVRWVCKRIDQSIDSLRPPLHRIEIVCGISSVRIRRYHCINPEDTKRTCKINNSNDISWNYCSMLENTNVYARILIDCWTYSIIDGSLLFNMWSVNIHGMDISMGNWNILPIKRLDIKYEESYFHVWHSLQRIGVK